jgi:uncharacterized ParB-like nuclease family protein
MHWKGEKLNARQTGKAIDSYLGFRAAQEGQTYAFTPEYFEQCIARGVVSFFGVTYADGKLTGDDQQPALFELWQMTKPIPITGFNPKRYVGVSIEEIPLPLILEPVPHHIRSPKRVKQYVKILKEGKVAPPIEIMQMVTPDKRPLKQPYEIFNGMHRYKAAVLAGRKTILAVVIDVIEYEPFNEDEYATADECGALEV